MKIEFFKIKIPIIFSAFLSGIAALIYQVAWMRLFIPIFGLSVYATSAVFSAFMIGLAFGSLVAKKFTTLNTNKLIKTYILIEIGIAVCAALLLMNHRSLIDLYLFLINFLKIDSNRNNLLLLIRFVIALLAMFMPTLLIGMTFPVLWSIATKVSKLKIEVLYAVNTLGACIGSLLAGFYLIWHFGLKNTILAAIFLNISVAIIFLLFKKLLHKQPLYSQAQICNSASYAQQEQKYAIQRLGNNKIYLLAAVSGFVALSLELAWFRILVFYVQSASESLALILSLILAGIAVGSIYVSSLTKGKSIETQLQLYTFLQLGLAILISLTLTIYLSIPGYWQILINLLGASSWLIINIQKALVIALLILPSSVVMGMSFPILCNISSLTAKNSQEKDQSIAGLYAINTFAAVLGIVATTFVFFVQLGLQNTLNFLAALTAVSGIYAAILNNSFSTSRLFKKRVCYLLAFYLLSLAITPSHVLQKHFQNILGEILYYKESVADIAVVTKQGHHLGLAFNDGRGACSTYKSINMYDRLQAYSTMIHKPDAKDVLVISMGCGNTASAYLSFPIRSLDVVDLSPAPFEAANLFYTNRGMIQDQRITTYVEDGRNFLLRNTKKYDIIQLELPTIHTDGVINLYTDTFYKLASERLNDGGLISQWIDAIQIGREPSKALFYTMQTIFPNAALWAQNQSWWLIGQKTDRISFDYHAIKELFDNQNVIKDMASVELVFQDLFTRFVAANQELTLGLSKHQIISDNHTKLDYEVGRIESPYAFGAGIGYYTSPFAKMFYQSWKKSELDWLKNSQMFSFFQEDLHDQQVDRSFKQSAQGFPDDLMQYILSNNAVVWFNISDDYSQ